MVNNFHIFDVTRFGAVGDGIHDDTNAVRKAIDKVPTSDKSWNTSGRQVARGYLVYFPSLVHRRRFPGLPSQLVPVKAYRITESVRISGNKNVRFFSDAPYGARLLYTGPADSHYVFISEAGKRAHVFENLYFHKGGVLLEGDARGITDFLTCGFSGIGDYAIKTGGPSVVGGRVLNCEFAETRGGIGILYNACDLWLIGHECRFVRIDGIAVECHSSGVTIMDSNFENKAPGAGFHPHIRIEPGGPFAGGLSKVVRCRFGGEVGRDAFGPPQSYIVLGPADPVPGVMTGITIQDCLFRSRTDDGPREDSGKYAIRITKGIKESRIIGNHFQKFAGFLIQEDFLATTNVRDNYFALNSIDSVNHGVDKIFSSGRDPEGWTIL